MHEPPVSVLHLEDSDLDADLIRHQLESGTLPVQIDRVSDRAQFGRQLSSRSYDLILSDYQVPGFQDLAALDLAQQLQPDTPFLFVTGAMGEELAVEAVKRGATDYVLKEGLSRLGPAVTRALAEARERAERRAAEASARRADAALRDSEARFRATFHHTAIGMAQSGLDGRHLLVNDRYCAITGYSRDELLQRTFLEITHPDDLAPNRTSFLQLVNGEIASYELQKRYVHQDGNIVWGHVSAAVVRNAAGEAESIIAAVQDITEQKRAEEDRRRKEQTLRFLADLGAATQPLVDPDAIMGVMAQFLGEHLQADRCAYAEFESDELHFTITGDFTRQLPSMVGRFRLSDFGDEAVRCLRANRAYVVDDVQTDPRAGSDKLLYQQTQIGSLVCVPLQKEGRLAAAVAVHQQTARHWLPEQIELVEMVVGRCWESIERARTVRSLRDSERRLQFIMDSMPQKIFTARASGAVDYYNPIWQEFTGLPRETIRDWGWQQFIHPDDVEANLRDWQHAVESGTPFEFEHRFRSADGQYRWHLTRAVPMRDDGGQIVMWIGSSTDIHEVKAAEESLKQADRRKDEFLATLAHELRNPLAPIHTGLELMRMAADDAPLVEEIRATMEAQARQLVRLVDDLLDVSRITRGKIVLRRDTVQLAAVVQTAVDATRALFDQAGHRLTVQLPTEPLVLHADAARLAQILSNLLTNAAKYTPRDGRISLTAERRGSEVEVIIQDNGIGIPTEMLGSIFTMFTQVDRSLERSQSGLGIGLTLVKRLVELHGGTVTADSPGAGLGSVFRVRLPIRVAPPATPQARGSVPPPAAPKPLRILIVDDNRDAARMLEMIVRRLGNEVQTAGDGQEALEAAASFRPDVVLMDLGMPKLNGYDAARQLRQQPWGQLLTLVALTGWGQAEDKRRSKAAGFDHHLVKPVELEALRALLAAI